MLRKGISFWVFVMMASTTVWSDEPPRAPGSVKQQRVSPKLLREALGLPEYQGKAAETSTRPPSLEDLQTLADRLKKSGDNDGADLLQRFIHEHQRLANQTSLHPTTGDARIDIQIKVVEVNRNGLAPDSPLLDKNPILGTNEIHAELDRLVAAKKAKMMTEPLLKMKINEVVRIHEGEDLPIPLPGEKGTQSVEFREFGTVIEVQATPITKEKIRLQLTCEISSKDEENAVTISGTSIPGVTKRKIQSTIETNFGEWTMPARSAEHSGHLLFVMARVTPSR